MSGARSAAAAAGRVALVIGRLDSAPCIFVLPRSRNVLLPRPVFLAINRLPQAPPRLERSPRFLRSGSGP